MYIVVIADGHGSDNCFRSEHGSKFAVEAAIEGIKLFITNLSGKKNPDERLPPEYNFARELKELTGTIVGNWIYKVSQHYRSSPITEDEMSRYKVESKYRELYLKEAKGEQTGGGGFLDEAERPVTRHAYGATLIAAAITSNYWFGIQIGDGKLTAVYPDGSFDQPVPWDDKCYLNVTTSICDDDAAERARAYVKKLNGNGASIDALGVVKTIEDSRPLPAAIFVNSDGVDDSFPIDENMDHMVKKFYFPVLRMFTENVTDPSKGWDASVQELADFLPGLSKRGSGDDISVSGIMDMESIQAAPFQAVLQKAKTEAEERRIREQAEREKREEEARIAAEEEKQRQAEAEADKKAAETEAKAAAKKPTVDPEKLAVIEQRIADKEQKIAAEEQRIAAAKQKVADQKQKLNSLKENVELSSRQRNAEGEAETDIPASDAKKTYSPGPEPGTAVDIKA